MQLRVCICFLNRNHLTISRGDIFWINFVTQINQWFLILQHCRYALFWRKFFHEGILTTLLMLLRISKSKPSIFWIHCRLHAWLFHWIFIYVHVSDMCLSLWVGLILEQAVNWWSFSECDWGATGTVECTFLLFNNCWVHLILNIHINYFWTITANTIFFRIIIGFIYTGLHLNFIKSIKSRWCHLRYFRSSHRSWCFILTNNAITNSFIFLVIFNQFIFLISKWGSI